MRTRVSIAAICLLLVPGGLITSAGAKTVNGSGVTRIDLASPASVDGYLRAHGIDPRSVVFQHGSHNYVGARCPGKAWTCTAARRVVQVSRAAAGSNMFECTPAAAATHPALATCVIVQLSASGSNHARCAERTSGSAESCNIMQTTTTGDNIAVIDQQIDQRADSSQSATQDALLDQQSTTGANSSHITQTIAQVTKADVHGELTQVQEGHQHVLSSQRSVAGDNSSVINQSLAQTAQAAAGGSITQEQNSDASNPEPRAASAEIDQNSTSGKNTSSLDQLVQQLARAARTDVDVTQDQGNLAGGLLGSVDQASSGLSTMAVSQKEQQTLSALHVGGLLSQSQIDPIDCCSTQSGNAADTCRIDQSSGQASDGGFQQIDETAQFTSSGNCDAAQSAANDSASTSATQSGPVIFLETFCESGPSETTTALFLLLAQSTGSCSTSTSPGD